MARLSFLLTFLATGLLPLALLRATEPTQADLPAATAAPTPNGERPEGRPDQQKRGPGDRGPRDGQIREWRKRLENMPLDERKKAFEKMRGWAQKGADEQGYFRYVEDERNRRAKQSIDEAIASGGLKLDETQRRKFSEIYKRERRALEMQLRSEMDKSRQERMPALQKTVLDAYQKEQTAPIPSASPSPTPAAP